MGTNVKEHRFFKGLNSDISYHNVDADYITHGLNLTLFSDDGDNYNITNERGTEELIPLPANTTIIGRYVIEDSVVFFMTDGINNEVGVYENGVYRSYIIDTPTNTTTLDTKTNTYSTWSDSSRLGFNINNPIKIRWRKSFNNSRMLYTVDGLNKPRYYNLDSLIKPTEVNPTPSIDDTTSLFNNQITPKIEYVKQIETGNLEVGSYQFLVQYLDADLNTSLFSNATNPIPVLAAFREVGRNKYVGSTRGTNASKSIILKVSDIDLDFKFIQLIVVRYTGQGDTLITEVVDRREITGTTMEFVYSDITKKIEEIDIVQLSDTGIGYTTASVIEDKDNTLLLANLKSLPIADLQELANSISLKYTIKEIPYTDVYPSRKQVGYTNSPSLTLLNMFVDEDEVDSIYIEFNKNMLLPAVTDIALISMVAQNAATPDTLIYNRITPNSVEVLGNKIKAIFTGVDFTDNSLYNFDSISVINNTDANHVPYYFLALGTDVTLPAGGTAGNPLLSYDSTPFNYINTIYTGIRTLTASTNTNPVDITLNAAANISIGDEIAIFGEVHTSKNYGLFTVSDVLSTTNILVDSYTAGIETVGTIIFTETTSDNIKVVQVNNITANSILSNTSYFSDYKDEKIHTELKSRKRGEVYSYAIRFIYNNGGKTPFFHIPGYNRSIQYDSTEPDNNKIQAIPDIPFVSGRRNNSTGILGTYISNRTYTSGKNYPSDNGVGINYSNGNNVRHHIMPSLEQEPIVRYDEDTQEYNMRILGLYPVILDSLGNETSIKDFLETNKNKLSGIVGYEIGEQPRTSLENKSIICQGIAQPTMQYNGSFGASIFAGRSSMLASTRYYFEDPVTYGENFLPDSHGYISNLNNHNVPYICQFYSPDILLLKTDIPEGAKIKPVATIYGDASTVYHQRPELKNKVSENFAGILHVFYNYNDFKLDPTYTVYKNTSGFFSFTKIEEAYTKPIRILEVFNAPSDVTTYGGTTSVTQYNLPLRNYGNEGFVALNLGSTEGLPVPTPIDDRDFNVTLQANQSGGTSSIKNTVYDIDSNINFLSDWYHSKQYARAVYDIVIDNISQYGDVTGVAYNVVSSINNYSNLVTIKDTIFFNGDVFINKCSFRNSKIIPTKYRVGDSNKIQSSNARQQGADTSRGEEWKALFWCWFESEANTNYRHVGVDENNNPIGHFFPYNSDLSLGGVIRTRQYIPVRETAKGLTQAGAMDLFPNITESNHYNSLYSVKDIINIGYSTSIAFESVNEYPNRIIYSTTAIEGEQQDSYRKFLVNNYHDLPKDKGAITILYVLGNSLYAHTKFTLFRTFFNEQAAIPSTSEEIYLGNGGKFNRPAVELFDIDGGYAGCEAFWGSTNTSLGRFFVDNVQGKVFLHTGQSVQELESSIARKLESKLSIDGYIDNPFIGNGLLAAYDYNFERWILCLNTPTEKFTLSYYPAIKNFLCEHSYIPKVLYSTGRQTHIISDTVLYSLGTGNYGNYFNTIHNSEIEICTNNLIEAVYDNLIIKSTVTDEQTDTIKHNETFEEYQVINDTCNSSLLPLTIDKLKYKRDGFNVVYPRSATINPYNKIESTTNIDANRLFLPRIKGKYARTRFIYKNLNNYKLVLNIIVSLFRQVAR